MYKTRPWRVTALVFLPGWQEHMDQFNSVESTIYYTDNSFAECIFKFQSRISFTVRKINFYKPIYICPTLFNK